MGSTDSKPSNDDTELKEAILCPFCHQPGELYVTFDDIPAPWYWCQSCRLYITKKDRRKYLYPRLVRGTDGAAAPFDKCPYHGSADSIRHMYDHERLERGYTEGWQGVGIFRCERPGCPFRFGIRKRISR